MDILIKGLEEFAFQIFLVVLTVCVPILLNYISKYFNAKMQESLARTDSAMTVKYMDMLKETVYRGVLVVNETFVKELKKEGKFTKKSATMAFNKAREIIMKTIPCDTYEYLELMFGDIDKVIEGEIETAVKYNKNSY